MGARLAGIVAALGLHLVLLSALLAHEPARSTLLAAAPIMIDLIAPPRPEPIKPVPPAQPPKPPPAVKRAPRPPETLPVLSAPIEAPSSVTAPPPPVIVAPPDPAPPAAPAAMSVAKAAAPVTPPVFDADYLLNPPPAYPRESRRNGEQGRVVLRVLVGTAGTAEEVRLRASSGHPLLDQAAQDAVRRWKFVPATRGAQAVPAWVLIPISFRLKG